MCLVRGAGKEQARHFKHKTVNTEINTEGTHTPSARLKFRGTLSPNTGENLHEPHARDCSRKQPVH